MKLFKRKWIQFILAILFIFNVLNVEAKGTMTLSDLQAKFPDGRYWNHMGNPGASNSVNN